ncbi:MAG: hypothetical protein J7647_17910 [Cyanobacteria bacterium SBLK]|nr:hypothetical protein [Cyanobacteria bacterium SBLK]
MNYLIYPTIDLYLYDLRDGLGQKTEIIQNNHNGFLRKLPERIHALISQIDPLFEVEYLELLEQQRTINLFEERQDYEGYAYPVRLSDTYGLLLDCSVTDPTSPQLIESIAHLKTILDCYLNQNSPTLGQTWMISGQLHDPLLTEQDIIQIAKECYRHLIPNARWDDNFKGQGKILDGTFFELWKYTSTIAENPDRQTEFSEFLNLAKNHHVIIALYPNLKVAKKAADLISFWMRLWCYRNKILWAYYHNRLLKRSLKEKFTKITQYIQNLEEQQHKKLNLEILDLQLTEAKELFTQYGIELTQLDFQIHTIEINLYNYQQQFETIEQKLKQETAISDLEILQKFAKLTENKFLPQVQKDAENLGSGLKLLEFAVNLIRAEVEVTKTESDRRFQIQFAIWGTAIAIGAVVADISAQFPTVIVPTVTVTDAPPPDANLAIEHPIGSLLFKLGVSEMWLAPWISLVSGVAVTLIFGGLLLCLKPLIQKRRSRR